MVFAVGVVAAASCRVVWHCSGVAVGTVVVALLVPAGCAFFAFAACFWPVVSIVYSTPPRFTVRCADASLSSDDRWRRSVDTKLLDTPTCFAIARSDQSGLSLSVPSTALRLSSFVRRRPWAAWAATRRRGPPGGQARGRRVPPCQPCAGCARPRRIGLRAVRRSITWQRCQLSRAGLLAAPSPNPVHSLRWLPVGRRSFQVSQGSAKLTHF